MNAQETSDRIEKIIEAQELIRQAMELVDEAVRGTQQQSHYLSYGKYGFNELLGYGNPYDSSLDSLIEALDEEIEDEDFENEF